MAKGPCPTCGKVTGNIGAHRQFCDRAPVEAKEAAMTAKPVERAEPRTERGRRRWGDLGAILTPLQQVRVPFSKSRNLGRLTGPWAYYIRPEGATIREALIIYPNGGVPDRQDDPKGLHGANASYYQERQKRKGFTYIGSTLTREGIQELVQTLERNRPEAVLDLEDQIQECTYTIQNSDRPDVRDMQKKRRGQLQRQLDYVKQPLDPVAMAAELEEIGRAQRLAKVDPNVLAVMKEMVGEVNAKFAAMVRTFTTTGGEKVRSSDMREEDLVSA